MRASPAFQLTVRRFGVWRGAVAALLLASVGCLVAFALADSDSVPTAVRAISVAVSIPLVFAGATLMRCHPVSLRWDTQRWNLGPVSSIGEEPWPGRLDVCLDLGVWMLLRFEHHLMTGGRRTRWIPVQRHGIESTWHALRCAVYSARSAQGDDSDLRKALPPESNE